MKTDGWGVEPATRWETTLDADATPIFAYTEARFGTSPFFVPRKQSFRHKNASTPRFAAGGIRRPARLLLVRRSFSEGGRLGHGCLHFA